MKKSIAYFFAFLMVLLVFSIFLISCKATPLPPDVHKEVYINKDSISHTKTIEHSKAIIDSLLIEIGMIKTAKPECDSVTQAAIANVLRTLNTKKQSGDNGYQIKYNELKKRLELIIKVGATKTEVTTDYKINTKIRDRFITKTITLKQRLPQWQLILMLIGSAALAFVSIKLVLLIRSKIPS